MSKLVLAAIVCCASLIALAAPVGAHAEIRESDPADGDTVATGVDELSMTFIAFDPSGPVSVEVRDGAGADVVAGEPEVSARDSVVTVPLEPLEAGEYRVHWHALSDDGDGIAEGDFTFTAEDVGGGIGIWLVWAVAIIIPAAIFLRPGARRRGSGSS